MELANEEPIMSEWARATEQRTHHSVNAPFCPKASSTHTNTPTQAYISPPPYTQNWQPTEMKTELETTQDQERRTGSAPEQPQTPTRKPAQSRLPLMRGIPPQTSTTNGWIQREDTEQQ